MAISIYLLDKRSAVVRSLTVSGTHRFSKVKSRERRTEVVGYPFRGAASQG